MSTFLTQGGGGFSKKPADPMQTALQTAPFIKPGDRA